MGRRRTWQALWHQGMRRALRDFSPPKIISNICSVWWFFAFFFFFLVSWRVKHNYSFFTAMFDACEIKKITLVICASIVSQGTNCLCDCFQVNSGNAELWTGRTRGVKPICGVLWKPTDPLGSAVLMLNFSHPNICWEGSMAGHEQSKKLLEYSKNSFMKERLELESFGRWLLELDFLWGLFSPSYSMRN